MTPDERDVWLLANVRDGAKLTYTFFVVGGTKTEVVEDDVNYNHLRVCETTWAETDWQQPDEGWVDFELVCRCTRPSYRKSLSMRRPDSW